MLRRIKNSFRSNANPSPIVDEALDNYGSAYSDPLIRRGHNNFLNKIDKRNCMYLDPIINTLTLGWSITATAKTFKFYDTHEIDGQEVMEEYRAWWQMNGLDELLKALIPHFCMDGRVLLDLYLEQGQIKYEVYGSYECDTIHWKRDNDNTILLYSMKFVPMPSAWGWAYGNSNVKGVDKEYKASEILHFTRGEWNYGIGQSRIGPIWDSTVKLRHGSYADFFRRDMRFIVAVPENWKKERTESFMNSFNDMMKGSSRAFVYKMAQSKDATQMPLELPRFGIESMARPAPKPMSQSESGGQLLRDPEWARLLSGCRLTENYFIGNQAGAVTGSEVDLTRDFYTECEEFGLLEPVIKGILNWCAMAGLIPPPPEDYVIKYWKDWEHIEKSAQMAEQQMEGEQQATQGQSNARNNALPNFSRNNAIHNEFVEHILLHSIRLNASMPMTPVASSWLKEIGYRDGTLFMETHQGYKYQKPKSDAEGQYSSWVGSDSKGGYYWDNFVDRSPPWQRIASFPEGMDSGYGAGTLGTPEEARQFKMEGSEELGIIGAGKTREPYRISPTAGQGATRDTTSLEGGTATQIADWTPKEFPSIAKHKPISAANPKGAGRKSKPGRKPSDSYLDQPAPVGYISLKNSAPRLNSQAYIKRLAEREMGWGMSNSTAQKIMQLIEINEKTNIPRYNSFVVGNVMDFDILLKYPDNPDGEKACPKAWKRINAHEGDLYLYENLAHGGKRYNVGKYKYWWDDKNNKNVIVYNAEEVFEEVLNTLKDLNIKDSVIENRIRAGKPPDVSTEYFCSYYIENNMIYQTNFHNSKGDPQFEGIAIVERGNCTTGACDFEILEEVE